MRLEGLFSLIKKTRNETFEYNNEVYINKNRVRNIVILSAIYTIGIVLILFLLWKYLYINNFQVIQALYYNHAMGGNSFLGFVMQFVKWVMIYTLLPTMTIYLVYMFIYRAVLKVMVPLLFDKSEH